jgi:acyl dehydratase
MPETTGVDGTSTKEPYALPTQVGQNVPHRDRILLQQLQQRVVYARTGDPLRATSGYTLKVCTQL